MVENYVHLNGKIMLHCIFLGKHTQKFIFNVHHHNNNKTRIPMTITNITWEKMNLKHKYNLADNNTNMLFKLF